MSQLTISTQEKRFPVAPDLYGLFFEDISHAGDGGLYPEMLRNRSFEDSLLPDGCITNDNGKTFTSPTGWIDEFNNGEGMNDWIASQKIAPTTIPAWYSENANMQLNKDNTLNDNRRVSLQVDFEENGKIYNIGYNGINQEKGDTYNFYLFAKSEQTLHLTVSIQINNQTSCSSDIIIGNAMMHNFWPLKQQEMLLFPFNVRKKEPFTLAFVLLCLQKHFTVTDFARILQKSLNKCILHSCVFQAAAS